MSSFASGLLYIASALIVPPLLIGFLRVAKARLQNRCGPPVLQPFWDLAKLLAKGETVSETTTAAFRFAPLLNLAATVAVALMVPWLGVATPIPGDLFLVVYAVALGKFCVSLAALDTGSPFGAIGASREAAIGLQIEPALLVGLAALAVHAHSSNLSILLTPESGGHMAVLAVLLVVSFWICATAELARMPVDDPATHLELTMVHEALILENSGRNLALIEYSVMLKTAVLLGLVGRVFMLMFPPQTPVVTYLLGLGLLTAAAGLLAVLESVLVKLRWRGVPNLLSYAIGASVLACLFVAMEG
ncbi:MAG: respiratory chain complex I subunit 1 family protein [Capsulimonadaceae bacterium]